MQERLSIIVSNLLNGVAPAAVAKAINANEPEVVAEFLAVMNAVAEYQLVFCVPYFPCQSVAEARRNRMQALPIVAAIERWDAFERDLILDFFKHGSDYVLKRYDEPKAAILKALERTLNGIPHYLAAREIAVYERDRLAFCKQHRHRVIECVERFTSLRNPLRYKNIQHTGLDANNFAAAANGSMLHQSGPEHQNSCSGRRLSSSTT